MLRSREIGALTLTFMAAWVIGCPGDGGLGKMSPGEAVRDEVSPELVRVDSCELVADTHRFLTKNIRFVARLMRSGGFYRPDGLLEGLAPHVADPRSGIVGLHLYTFNAVAPTESWRRQYVDRLAGGRA